MFRIIRVFPLVLVAFCAICFCRSAGAGAAFDVPITVESDLDGILPYTERGTCDPEFRTVMNHRAWEAAQREITQNANVIARPDSILSLSCFGEWLNHAGYYATEHFPGHPEESRGIVSGGSQTDNYPFHSDLEILLLDQLVTVLTIPEVPLCPGGKFRYIEDGFPGLMIGDRAKGQAAVPEYDAIPSWGLHSVSTVAAFACTRMNDVWHRTKCYDASTESAVYKANHSGVEHDGYYTYESYVAHAEAGLDYRAINDMCFPPVLEIEIELDPAELACFMSEHGTPGMLTRGSSITDHAWTESHEFATTPPGGAGAMDAFLPYFDMIGGTTCAPPISIGVLLSNKNGRYISSICPNPGCRFTPNYSTSGITGTCTN